MYNQFFGFAERPFRLAPDPAYLFLSAHHEEALAHLKYAVSEGEGFVEITGEVGTGKTLLCRTFLEQLDDRTESAYIFNPRLSARELIQAVNDEFGITTAPGGEGIKALIDSLNAFLMEKKAQGKKVVLVIDEAQNLGRDVLEQVRLLSNLETTRSKLLQIILVGQPELSELLDSHELRQLGQRITLSCRLRPLTRKETGQYIRHRLQVASRKIADIFTRSAINKIHRYSGGIPRLINIAGDRALLCAYGFNQHKVSAAIATAAIAELASRGEVHRRDAGAFSPGWGRRLGLLSVLVGLVLVFFFQSDIRAILAAWAKPRISDYQAERAAPEVNVLPPASVPPDSGVESETDGSLPQRAAKVGESAGGRIVADETVSGQLIHVEPVPEAAVPGSMGTPMPVAITPDADLSDRPGPHLHDTLPTIPHDVVSLADYLAATPAAGSRERAIKILLSRWGLDGTVPGDIGAISDDASFFAAAAALNGLALHRIKADADLIRRLNLCAILTFDMQLEQGFVHLAAVAAGDQTMILDNGSLGLSITAPDEEIARHGTGDAYVFWKNFYNYPDVIPVTSPGAAVVTLKLHLRDLGHDHLDIGPVYDPATRQAVERIQAAHGIPVDGFVGPLTMMVLYNQTNGLVVPRLRDSSPAGNRPDDSDQDAAPENSIMETGT